MYRDWGINRCVEVLTTKGEGQSGAAACFTRATAAAYKGLTANGGSGAVDLEAASLRSASALRIGPTLPTVGASHWDWDWNSL